MRLTEYSHGAGCACKLSPVELGQILGALPPVIDPNVLHASASRDDAAVYRIAPDRALVATVDFFTPIVDDPFEFGAIAAANPLCSGLVTTAVKRGLCPPALERQAVDVMMTLNREAARAMLDAGATAATDVTGFGLIGHMVNLAGGADIDFSAVPFLDGVRELADLDIFPSGSRRNHGAYRDAIEWNGLPEVEQLMLCDAQTSGGLLVAISPP